MSDREPSTETREDDCNPEHVALHLLFPVEFPFPGTKPTRIRRRRERGDRKTNPCPPGCICNS